MKTIPCPLCGYHAPESTCPHCRLAPDEASLARPPAGRGMEWLDGLRAFPKGIALLLTTRRIKRLLVPPVLLTGVVFGTVLYWTWSWIERFFEAARLQSVEVLGMDEGWLRDSIQWLLERGAIIVLAKASTLILFAVASSLIALWTFSIVYEAVAGPFLDEVHSRLETRWFGKDPLKELERPNAMDPARCARFTWLASGIALAWLAWWSFDARLQSLWWLALLALPFLVLAFVAPDWGRWLWWVLTTQLRTLFVSVKASLLAGTLLVLFLWLKFVPVIGYFLFAALAGFCTAITLLDIPFSRRRLGLRQRVRFMLAHLVPLVLFGCSTSLVFIVPFFGPLVGVPAASIGGLWLLCRLDKNRMRPPERRMLRSAQTQTSLLDARLEP